jgi:hypothetical protein
MLMFWSQSICYCLHIIARAFVSSSNSTIYEEDTDQKTQTEQAIFTVHRQARQGHHVFHTLVLHVRR